MKRGSYARYKVTGQVGILVDCRKRSNVAFIQFSEKDGCFTSKSNLESISKKEAIKELQT